MSADQIRLCHIEHGDSRGVLPAWPAGVFDSCVTDPPYELGFMGKAWDRSGIANDPALWREVFRVLKPGAFLIAFGGTRTYHRMVCAIEDAGFEIRDSLHWIYGSGFPKSLNVSKAIEPASAASAVWSGWGTALKPSHEPIVLARKPLIGTVASNVLAHGAGALNIDGCRVAGINPSIARRETAVRTGHAPGRPGEQGDNITNRISPETYMAEHPGELLGRWPPNTLFTHSDTCTDVECDTDCPVRELDAQSGVRKSGAMAAGTVRAVRKAVCFGEMSASTTTTFEASEGGASRFFPVFRYEAKPSKRARGEGNTHPTVKPVPLMRWLVRLVTRRGGLVLDPFAGSGTTGVACVDEGFEFVGIEQELASVEIAKARLSKQSQDHKEGQGQRT